MDWLKTVTKLLVCHENGLPKKNKKSTTNRNATILGGLNNSQNHPLFWTIEQQLLDTTQKKRAQEEIPPPEMPCCVCPFPFPAAKRSAGDSIEASQGRKSRHGTQRCAALGDPKLPQRRSFRCPLAKNNTFLDSQGAIASCSDCCCSSGVKWMEKHSRWRSRP